MHKSQSTPLGAECLLRLSEHTYTTRTHRSAHSHYSEDGCTYIFIGHTFSTRWMTLFCQSAQRTATYSILIIVGGRGDSHQRSLPIKLHGHCGRNDRWHASPWMKGEWCFSLQTQFAHPWPFKLRLLIAISKVIKIIYTHHRWSSCSKIKQCGFLERIKLWSCCGIE